MRKNQAKKRDVLPDPIYNSKLVTKAINMLMWDGKRWKAQDILYGAFKRPSADNQVPTEVSPQRKITLGLRWLVLYSRNRNEKTMLERLSNEIIDASNGIGAAVKKREDTHKMAEANKAFANLRF